MTSHFRRIRLASASLACVTLLAACSSNESANADSAAVADSAANASAAAATPSAAPAAPNDAQIAHIAVTASSIDSTAGVMAQAKATSKDVKDFAQMMVNEHGAVNKQAVALVTKLGVTPEDNETSRALSSAGEASRTNLQGMSGAAFDRAYMDSEVTYHQTVVDAVDRTLIPNAQNAELKALLEKARPNFVAHLERARTIQASLAK